MFLLALFILAGGNEMAEEITYMKDKAFWDGIVSISFKCDNDLTEEQAKILIESLGLKVKKCIWLAFGEPFRYIDVMVPIGEEDKWIDNFSKMDVVSNASRSPIVRALVF